MKHLQPLSRVPNKAYNLQPGQIVNIAAQILSLLGPYISGKEAQKPSTTS